MNIVTLTHGRGQLPHDAAESISRIDDVIDGVLPITEAGRTWERQLYFYNGYIAGKPGFNRALHPSNPLANHVMVDGRRGAIDTEAVRLGIVSVQTMNDHGFYQDAPDEYWHFSYFVERDKKIHEKVVTGKGKGSMEFYLLDDKGDVHHVYNGGHYVFTSAGDYEAWKQIVDAARANKATNAISPPPLGSLKKIAKWRVDAVVKRYA